ncbi:LytR C-terminal domain-containing protein [Jidongwangia harbinensis]|uniref:LytR C-terminal domain-containing protein n=1 Tax=Jidongwangia harbinensis TaxID=2878561 RepID=UPI001CDA3FC9|nr:LytR C-terminal domain-containing protein [Jidongwangia harbinensis]MCA2216092.1 LytR C-terminal domain-containing protein [Jidongwangia harbinensis]
MSFARVRALVVIGVLAVAAVVFVVVALVQDSQGDASADGGCPDGAPVADITLPDDPAEVKVKVYNGTRNAGLAEKVTTDFKNRGFVMQDPGKSKTKFDKIAIIRYGPKTVADAQLLKAYFLGDAKDEYSAKRTSDVVDIVVGNGFRQLATSTEVNQSLSQLGEPELPFGACPEPADADKKAK